MNEPIGILYVDDNVALAESIRLLVEAEPDMRWIGHLPNAESLPARVQTDSPEIILLDLSMPGPDPLDVLNRLGANGLQARAIIVSGFIDDQNVTDAIDAGAWGYVGKYQSPDAIFRAIRRVARGEVVFPSLPAQRHCEDS